MKIEIINKNHIGFAPRIGEQTLELLGRISKKLDEDEVKNLEDEAVEILSHCNNPHEANPQRNTILAVGYVQSGKTMSFTVLSALAHDNGFRIIIYFAGTKNNLLRQTTKRLEKDLVDNCSNVYKIFESPEENDARDIGNTLKRPSKPTILITVLKHPTHISHLAKIFSQVQTKRVLGSSGVLIIDDEADQASLNGYAYKNSKSEDWEEDEYTATYREILNLRNAISNHTYIQYTATPQGPLLISLVDMLSPDYHKVLTPGKSYTGGKTFFNQEPGLIKIIPDEECYHSKKRDLKECPKSLVDALQLHLIGVAIVVKIQRRQKYLSMMVHADREQDASEKFYKWIDGILNVWGVSIEGGKNDIAYIELKKLFKKNYQEAISLYKRHNESYPPFEDVWSHIPDIIWDTNKELVISRNKKYRDEIKWENSMSHILVGADMLNRGFTVENLAITYMPRHSLGKSTADTIQQRCRFLGYKRSYLWSCRVFLPVDVINDYKDYVDHEEEMRSWLMNNKSLEEVKHQLLISSDLNATRRNVLTKDIVTTKLIGWRQTNAFQTIEKNIKYVDDFIDKTEWIKFKEFGTPDRNHRFAKLDISDVIDFLWGFTFQNIPDAARKETTLRYLKYLDSNRNLEYAYIFQMAYNGAPRERKFDSETCKINNLHTGHSNKGSRIYPGDKEIKFEDSICIQIHRVKLKCDSIQWGGKVAYTLAIYYPDTFAINYIGEE